MLHSLVIQLTQGLTLSISSGAEFSKSLSCEVHLVVTDQCFSIALLITAIIFHQLFEGLSLGIRIAALPSSAASAARGILYPQTYASVHLRHHARSELLYVSPCLEEGRQLEVR